VLKLVLSSIIALPGSGGLGIAAKPGEDVARWKQLFENRPDALRIIEPGGPWKCNLLEYILRSFGSAREVTRFLTVVNETLRSGNTKGGESSDFWERENERQIYHAVVILRIALGRVSAPELQTFISGAAQSQEEKDGEKFKKGFHAQCLRAAYEAQKSPADTCDVENACMYWLEEYPSMDHRTRSNVNAGVMGLLFALNSGVVREMISTTTTTTPEDAFNGIWFLVNFPISEGGDAAAAVNAGWKYAMERAILKRQADEASNVVAIVCDEAPQTVFSFDAAFINQARSHKGALVMAGQSLPQYYAALKGEDGRHQTDALMAGFSTKVFMALGDEKTAKFAQGLVGRHRDTFIGGSLGPVKDLYDEMVGKQNLTTSVSEHYEFVLQTNDFMHNLRTGGPPHCLCDGVVVKSGLPFASGRNWMACEFSQRDL
jgi:hypothetical protein